MINPYIINTFKTNAVGQFIIEDTKIRDLNGGIRKKFTSLANSPVTYTHIYDPTIFRWDFGDGSPIYETNDRVTYHTFRDAGTYIISHQSCYPCGGPLVCSNGWCTQSITITPPGKDLTALAIGSIFGFLVFKGIDCEPRNTKETCEELRDYCRWVEKEKKCVRKCNEGYKLEKERTDDIKKPFKLGCVPVRERSKEKLESLKEKK